MKLYDSVGPNPRVVRMFMAEKGIEMPKQTVDLRKGENREAEHLKRNPHGDPTLAWKRLGVDTRAGVRLRYRASCITCSSSHSGQWVMRSGSWTRAVAGIEPGP